MDAQRSLALQDAMPASTALYGYPQLKMEDINRALLAWEKRRGFTRPIRPLLGSGWQAGVAAKKKRAIEAKKEAKPVNVAPKATNRAPRASQARPKAKAERTEADRLAHNLRVAKYRAQNRERIREQAKLAAAKHLAQMTPEQVAERRANERKWAAQRKAKGVQG
jgi:hypothetical protein